MRSFPVEQIGVIADTSLHAGVNPVRVKNLEFRSGDALFAFDDDLRILSWNRAAEELTGIPAEEAISQPCWQVLCGLDLKGAVVCHGGCSNARLAAEGWQVSAQRLLIKTSGGRRPVTLSTIALRGGERPIYLHLLRDGAEIPHPQAERAWDREPRLTRRQLEVLRLLGDGMPAKVIARRLGIAETTVRNHIRTILRELGSHSQLEALAKARRLRLVG